MRGILTFVVAAAAATLTAGGCSSDSSAPVTSSGGASGEAGASGATGVDDAQCTGDYAALKQSQFDAQLDSAGKCTGPSDSVIVCANDVTKTAEECGSDCFQNDASDDATQDACTKSCLEGGTKPSLSAACIGCYVTDVGCARDHCLLSCGTMPTGSVCASCRLSNGCAQAFFACSGLPSGGIGSGGAAGAGGS